VISDCSGGIHLKFLEAKRNNGANTWADLNGVIWRNGK